jgi:hypothetical protein
LAVPLHGAITLNGGALPVTSLDRGALSIQLAGYGAPTEIFALGTQTSPAYSVHVLPGSYVLAHQANAAQCDSADAPMPCIDQVLKGCP